MDTYKIFLYTLPGGILRIIIDQPQYNRFCFMFVLRQAQHERSIKSLRKKTVLREPFDKLRRALSKGALYRLHHDWPMAAGF